MNFEEGSAELGKANRNLAEIYVAVLGFEEALPYCLKALEIHGKQLGHNPVEVAHDRKLLGIVYSGLEEHEKVLEQNVLVLRILKNWNLNSDLLQAEIDGANMMIALGRHDEAVSILKNVILQTDEDSETRVLVLISLAKALFNQEKFAECKSCLEISLGILDKRERISPVEFAEAYTDIMFILQTLRHDFATESQTHVIYACEGLEASAEDKLREACQLVEQLEKKEHGASANANGLPMKALRLPQTPAASRISLPDLPFAESQIVLQISSFTLSLHVLLQ